MLPLEPSLELYVVWDPRDTPPETQAETNGHWIAESLFDHFRRPVYRPSGESLGVEVYFRNTPMSDGSYREIELAPDEDTAIFVLIVCDFNLASACDDPASAWSTFASHLSLLKSQYPERITVQVVAMHEAMFSLDGNQLTQQFGALGWLKAFTTELSVIENSMRTRFVQKVIHACDRSVRKCLAPEFKDHDVVPVFLSHTKSDQRTLSLISAFQGILAETTFDQFLDFRDLQPGEDYEKAIDQTARNCMMLALRTDSFSRRRWCIQEVFTAKAASVPIVWVDAVDVGEVRPPADLANMPRVQVREGASGWEPSDLDNALTRLLDEALSMSLWHLQTRIMNAAHPDSVDWYTSTAPEPFTLRRWLRGLDDEGRRMLIDAGEIKIMHPDPPLLDHIEAELEHSVMLIREDGCLAPIEINLITPQNVIYAIDQAVVSKE